MVPQNTNVTHLTSTFKTWGGGKFVYFHSLHKNPIPQQHLLYSLCLFLFHQQKSRLSGRPTEPIVSKGHIRNMTATQLYHLDLELSGPIASNYSWKVVRSVDWLSFAYTFNGREQNPNKNKTASQCFPESMMKALFSSSFNHIAVHRKEKALSFSWLVSWFFLCYIGIYFAVLWCSC